MTIETWEDGQHIHYVWYSLREVKRKAAASGKEVYIKVWRRGCWEYWCKPAHCRRFRRGWDI